MSRDPLDLTGHLVLLSGGAGSLGAAITDTLLLHHAEVAVADPAAEQDRTTDRYLAISADCSNASDVELLLTACEHHFHRQPDTVGLHAGIVAAHPIQDYPLEEFDQLMKSNLRAAFVLAQASTRRWIKDGSHGSLIFTTSWVQDVPWPGIAPYSASKAALRSLTRSFARELAPHGIRANALAPGIVAAGLAQHQWDTDPEYRHRANKAIPLGHLQSPQSVADAFLFLASPLSSYMTGSTLLVDGGCSLYPLDEPETVS